MNKTTLAKYVESRLPTSIQRIMAAILGASINDSNRAWRAASKLWTLNQQLLQQPHLYTSFADTKLKALAARLTPHQIQTLKIDRSALSIAHLNTQKTCAAEDLTNWTPALAAADKQCHHTSTGGTGGRPTPILHCKHTYRRDMNHVLAAWSAMGLTKGMTRLSARGSGGTSGKIKFRPFLNEFQVTATAICDHIKADLTRLPAKPLFLFGYPSLIRAIAPYLRECKITIAGICYASETINCDSAQTDADALGAPWGAIYGHSERLGFAVAHKDNQREYEVLPSYGIIQILDESGNPVSEGTQGEITCTGFINESMPLIRYRTGDSATLVQTQDGIALRIKDIVGRWNSDHILDYNSRKIPMTAVNSHDLAKLPISNLQFANPQPGIVKISVTRDTAQNPDGLSERTLNTIRSIFEKRLLNCNITVAEVSYDELFKSKRGKVPLLTPSTQA
jgi:phenylacetate-coenzyme A ligase PaaK-like adenylate-forming protein